MILALDIGGTNIRSAIVSKTKLTEFKKTNTPKSKKEILQALFQIISTYKKPKTIHIATAGFERNGLIEHAINMDFRIPLRKILKEKCKIPICIENDANCAALAELKFGAGKTLKNFILLTLGTGIGGAIIIEKKLYKGNGGAGEIGSMIIHNEKIFESFASGSAFNRIAKKKTAKQTHKEVGRSLGIGLANIAYIFDPDAIILGGGFSEVKQIYPETKRTLSKLYKLNPKPKIIHAKFGDNAGLIGAGLLKH